jgi:hypothetical protein
VFIERSIGKIVGGNVCVCMPRNMQNKMREIQEMLKKAAQLPLFKAEEC